MYEVDDNNRTLMNDEKNGPTLLANFAATIDKETRFDDGSSKKTVLTISGKQGDKELEEVDVEAEKFASLGWIMPAWGVGAVVQPGNAIKEHLRTSIQVHSKPKLETVYTHTGWTVIGKKNMYLHAKGAITSEGNDTSQRVQLPPELRHYEILASNRAAEAVRMTLSMLEMGKPEIIWPLIGAIVCPMHGPVDFAVHLTGRTGTFKSEIASIVQSHYGSAMDSRALPGSWSSTANALEAQAFRAKNAVFVVDDFIPTGTSWQVRAYQKTADQLLRGQGNQSGRARLTDTSNLQTTMYPRGMILSTGEDTPDGHSIRARMFICELAPGDIDTGALSKLQAGRELLPETMGNFAKYLAPHLKGVQAQIKTESAAQRDNYIDVGHSRTPTSIGRLLASLHGFLTFAKDVGAIDEAKRKSLGTEMMKAILAVGDQQAGYLTAADPCEAFCESIRHILASHIGHLRTKDGGIPSKPESLGWTAEGQSGDLPMYKSHGKCIGWIDWNNGEILVDVTGAYGDIRRHANGVITFTKQTMLKRLKDAGLLTRVDDTRQRNTIRVTCENHPRQVLAMPVAEVLETQEKPNEQF